MNLPEMDDATRQVIVDSIRANAASDDEEDEEELLQMLNQPSGSATPTASTSPATAAAHTVAPQALGLSDSAQADITATLQQSPESHQQGNNTEAVPTPRPKAFRLPPSKVDAESLKDYAQWDPN